MKFSRYKLLKYIVTLVILFATNWVVIKNINYTLHYQVSFDVSAEESDTYQLFYVIDGDWSEENSIKKEFTEQGKTQKLTFKLPGNITKIRFDTGSKRTNIILDNLQIEAGWEKVSLFDSISSVYFNQIEINGLESISFDGNSLKINSNSQDPYFIINLNDLNLEALNSIQAKVNIVLKSLICIIVSLLILMLIKRYRLIFDFLKEILISRQLIWNLSKNDFKTRFAGSYLGIIWAFVQPVVIVIIYWFVFQIGFRSAPISNFPYILWLVSGIVPWFFFNESIANAANSMLEYSYLVKKVVFKISILPIVKITSAMFVHTFFIAFTILLFTLYGYYPDLFMLQVIYYTLCTYALALAISYFTCSVIVFFRDLGQIIAIFLQIGMWITPILWSYSMIPEKLSFIYKLNPIYYIVEGYRDCFINRIWFWQKESQTVYFMILLLLLFYFGISVFSKLKVHFADVL
jgi:teichoic acid transport system permease protein